MVVVVMNASVPFLLILVFGGHDLHSCGSSSLLLAACFSLGALYCPTAVIEDSSLVDRIGHQQMSNIFLWMNIIASLMYGRVDAMYLRCWHLT